MYIILIIPCPYMNCACMIHVKPVYLLHPHVLSCHMHCVLYASTCFYNFTCGNWKALVSYVTPCSSLLSNSYITNDFPSLLYCCKSGSNVKSVPNQCNCVMCEDNVMSRNSMYSPILHVKFKSIVLFDWLYLVPFNS